MDDVIVAWLALVLSLVTAIASGITYFLGLRRQKQTATLDAYNRLQNEALDPLYMNYTKKKMETLVAHCRDAEYKAEYKLIGTYIARIEHFCVGVNQGIYDRETVFKLADGFFNGTICDLISPIIDKKDECFHGNYYANTRAVFVWLNKKH